ncbi:hypothetical protein [Bacillus halotolerans]|uniref:hypothetical protein n=1 Tax=Bacillus halotolerans TaxID=260554 RepID=UPI0013013A4C|nr:hypothetical protein [Bacillus halotolerans]
MKTLIIAAGTYKIPAPIIPNAVLEPNIKACISVFLDFKLSNTRIPAITPINRAMPGIKKSVRIPDICPIIDNTIPIKLDNTTNVLIAFHPFLNPFPLLTAFDTGLQV